MIPCNVIVYENVNRTVVSVIKPTVAMGMINNEELKQIAEKIETKLEHVFEAVK